MHGLCLCTDQNSPSTSGTTQAATAATQSTSTKQVLIEQIWKQWM